MRIFQVIPHTANSLASPTLNLWKYNLYMPLVDMGHDVYLLPYNYNDFFNHSDNIGWLEAHKSSLTQVIEIAFTREHQKKPFQLFFSYLYNGFIDYNILDWIRNQGVVVVNYSCNNVHQFHIVDEISRHVDFCIFPEASAEQKFKKLGVPAIRMPMAANPRIYRPYEIDSTFDVTFVGQCYADRIDFLSYLLKNGIDVRIWGRGWQKQPSARSFRDRLAQLKYMGHRFGIFSIPRFLFYYALYHQQLNKHASLLSEVTNPPLTHQEMIRLYSMSRINLGFSTVYERGRVGGKKLRYVRLRDFEVPMSGGFYITGYSEEIEEYYEVDKEVVCYSSKEELLEKVKYYLTHETAREVIRLAGYKRCLEEHTWEQRFQSLFSAIPQMKKLI